MKRKVIITGATGFLGKNLLCTLLKRNIEVTAIVRNAYKLSDIQNGLLCIVEADLADYGALDKRIPAGDYDIFYHFAWNGTSGNEREDYRIQVHNIRAACEAVAAAKNVGCKRFINAGSLMEYESMKLMEHASWRPQGNYLYRFAKLAAHYMAKAEAGRIGLPFINMIISNVYGEGEISARLISSTLQKLIRHENVSYTAGAQLYDFIHIEDASEAFYQVGERGKPFCDYYIGSGQIRPLREYIEEIYACLPIDQKPIFGDYPFDGVQLFYEEFDKNALYRDTGFRCKIPFSEGIQRAYMWMEKKYGTELERKDV